MNKKIVFLVSLVAFSTMGYAINLDRLTKAAKDFAERTTQQAQETVKAIDESPEVQKLVDVAAELLEKATNLLPKKEEKSSSHTDL